MKEKTLHIGKGTKLKIIETKELPEGTIIIDGAQPADLPPIPNPEDATKPADVNLRSILKKGRLAKA